MQRRKALLAAAMLLTCITAFGQTDRGTITGTVEDANGAAVAGATVTVTHLGTNVSLTFTTNSEGRFTAPSLAVGDYKVKVERSGFKSSVIEPVAVSVGSTINVTPTLTVGDVTQTVEITGVNAATLQTESAKISSTVANKLVEELPLVVSGAVRNPFDLAVLTPEAKAPNADSTSGTGSNFAIGGGQAGAWGITLDGASAGTARFGSTQWASLNTPSLDAITEFAVDTNGYKAEFGRAQGGIISFASKSGTNNFHGTAYEFLRNDALDARGFFQDNGDDPLNPKRTKPVFKQHDFGGSFGGPVWIPKLYHGKNKTFFFTSIEYFRNRVGASPSIFNVPTPEMYNGDFSKLVDSTGKLVQIYDPATTRPNPNGAGFIRDPFPGNIIPQNRFSPFAKNYLAQVFGDKVFPNLGGTPGTYAYVNQNFKTAAGSLLNPWTKFSAKVDHNFNEKNKLNFLFNYSYHGVVGGPSGYPGLPEPLSAARTSAQRSDVYRLNYTRIIRPTIVNSFVAGGNYWRETNRSINAVGGWKNKVCLPGVFDCDPNLLNVNLSGYFNTGDSAGDGSENPIFTFADDLSITKGRHTFKMGYLNEIVHYNGFGRQSLSGFVRFNPLSTSIPNSGQAGQSGGGGNSFASFLLGQVFSAQTENNRFVAQQFRSHSLYYQDDWKVNNKLTVNLGLRYEFSLPPREADDKWSDFDPTRPNPGADNFPGALIFAGKGEGRTGKRTLIPGWYGGWSPRFSFAYQLDEKTVVRGGAARSFGILKAVSGSTHFLGAIQIFNQQTLDNGVTPFFILDNGFINPTTKQNIVPQPPSTDPAFANNGSPSWWQGVQGTRLPENYNFTLSIQRQVGKNWLVETSYNGSMGAHLVNTILNFNQIPWSIVQQYGPNAPDPAKRGLITANINDPRVVALGIKKPYPSFNKTLGDAFRQWPQFASIDTGAGQGDRSGHSTYHAFETKVERRFGQGLTLQGSYVFSKLLTDADSNNTGNVGSADHFNLHLDKSIGAFDITHNVKVSYIYELPFGKGKRFEMGRAFNAVLGGWRVSAVHLYSSGTPLSFGTNRVNYPGAQRISPDVTRLDGWFNTNFGKGNLRSTNVNLNDKYFVSACSFVVACDANGIPVQPVDRPGNLTRFNPKMRAPANLTENFSLAKSFNITEKTRLDFRAEMFNAFNRVIFAIGNTNIQSGNFGLVNSQANDPKRMQFALKLYF
jgi:hypothetical protein